jgi:hypothetical protein
VHAVLGGVKAELLDPASEASGVLTRSQASWSDKSLAASKKFYPKDVKTPEGRLRHYATRFPLVEVDTTYYAILSASKSMTRITCGANV